MIICGDSKYKEAAEFYAEKLGIPDETIIAIGLYTGMEIAGYCEYHDDEALPYFLIGIDTEEQGEDDPLSTLAHEIVHVRQYVTEELVDKNSYCLWKGKRYEAVEVDTEDYYTSPWEIDAYGRQVGLYKMYLRYQEGCEK